MPTVLRIGPYRFHFYADEGNEPPHIHVECGDGECKFWLVQVEFERKRGTVKEHQVREIERLVTANRDLLLRRYREFHG